MELYVMRHGIAELHGLLPLSDDSTRVLTKDGVRRMHRIGQAMKSLELPIDVVLSSPYDRARQSAEIVAKECGASLEVELTAALVPGGDPSVLIREIVTRPGSFRGVLLVGHEPCLSRLISMLLTGDEDCSIILKKGGLCKLVVEKLHYGRCATLEWLAPPRILQGLA